MATPVETASSSTGAVSPVGAEGRKVVQYLNDITREANLNAAYTIEGDEVVIGIKP